MTVKPKSGRLQDALLSGRTTDGRRSHSISEQLRSLADRQHGVVSRFQLIELNLPGGTIDGRLASNLLIPVYPGVYAVGRPITSQESFWMAGVLAAGEGAVLARESAAALWGILRNHWTVEVVRRESRKPRGARIDGSNNGDTRRLFVRRTRNLPKEDVTVLNGIPVVTMIRLLIDLSASLSPDELRKAFIEADRLGLVDVGELLERLSSCRGHKGVGILRKIVLRRAPDIRKTKSFMEGLFLTLCHEHGLPRPEVNLYMFGFSIDCIWRDRQLAVELDSHEFHRDRTTLEKDAAKGNRLDAEGWSLLRFSYWMVTEQGDEVVALLRARLVTNPEPGTRRQDHELPRKPGAIVPSSR